MKENNSYYVFRGINNLRKEFYEELVEASIENNQLAWNKANEKWNGLIYGKNYGVDLLFSRN